jgi:hypothetical protein
MTTTTRAPGRVAFDPDYYLDCRRPEWRVYEGRGLVRFEHGVALSAPVVFVDDDCVEVLRTLRAHIDRWSAARR